MNTLPNKNSLMVFEGAMRSPAKDKLTALELFKLMWVL